MQASSPVMSARVLAILAFLFFVPPIASFAIAPGVVWFEYPGILFHLAMFFLVWRLPAPEWGRAAGYVWIALDVMTGALMINGVPYQIAINVRLGGHIFAGIWLVAASLASRSMVLKVVGVIAGAWLGGFTFVSPFLPKVILGPNSLLILVWLGIVAWLNEDRHVAAPRPLEQVAAG